MGWFDKKSKQEAPEENRQEKKSWLSRLSDGLSRTRSDIAGKLDQLIKYYKEIDDEFFEELEAVLISADIGAAASAQIVNELREQVKKQKIGDAQQIRTLLRESIAHILEEGAAREEETFPLLLFIVGVNGVGKTTAIGKLAHFYKEQGKSVLVAAGDTFRAAAAQQLEVWAQRSGAAIIKGAEGADPASVVFDAVQAAKARKTDVLICDTAGRLHNKKNLMDELSKIGRVIAREYPEASRKNLIVLDATTGQNALMQVKAFSEAVGLDGIILTKLDGTAKGGVAVAIKKEMQVPVLYIGVGEGMEDLQPFRAGEFAGNII